MDDAPAEIEIRGQRFPGQIISVQGSEVAVGIEKDFGPSVAQARVITNTWYLLEALRKRFEDVLSGQLRFEGGLGDRLFGLVCPEVQSDLADLNLPVTAKPPNDEQISAIRKICGSDVHFIWGPPGTGKTETIGLLVAILLSRNLRVLIASHTNVATDNAINKVATLLQNSEDFQSGKFVRLGNISPNASLPEMVIPEKIAARLGVELNEHLSKMRSQLAHVQTQLAELGRIGDLLKRQGDLNRSLESLRGNRNRFAEEHEAAKSHLVQLSKQVEIAKARLAEAQTASALKRLLRRLNPVKLELQVAELGTNLSTAQRVLAAGPPKLAELQSNLESTQTRGNQVERDLLESLSRVSLAAGDVPARVGYLTSQLEEISKTIRLLEAELEALAAKILREAKLIATSLTKATISKQLDAEKFDVLVVDEASMAPMPALYFAAGRATQKAIVVGDFRQLPPICVADSEAARKWLARDIFDQSGVQTAVDTGEPEPRLTMLRRQYRMHPAISAICNKVFYGGQLEDCLSADDLEALTTKRRRSPLGTSPLVLYDVSAANPWSSRLEQGGRYNLYSAVLSAELAKRAVQVGMDSVGVISPYAIHARLIKMILEDSDDARLRRLKVSTVHRFQGLEEDLIIFDIAEGPMPRFGPSGLVDGFDLSSQAAKLINVSITRPRAQLAVVANVSYLASRLRHNAILKQVIDEMRRCGTVVDSRQVVEDYVCEDYERWATLLNPRNDEVDPSDGNLYTERNFYAAFFADLRSAEREIVVVSPFLTAARAQQFFDLLRRKIEDGIEVRIFTKKLREQQGDMFRQSEIVVEGLKQIGAQVVEKQGIHQKFAFIDRKVAWEGSLNILSQSEGRSTEHMRRLPSEKACQELIELHEFGSDAEVEAGSRHRIKTDRTCKIHGAALVLVPGPYGLFLGCPEYPKCQERYSIARGDQIGTDVKCPGAEGMPCHKAMVAVRGRYGVYLRCSDPNCKAKRNLAR